MFFLFLKILKKKVMKYSNMKIYQQQLPMVIDTFKKELDIKDGLKAIVKHNVEFQTLHWKQVAKSLDV